MKLIKCVLAVAIILIGCNSSLHAAAAGVIPQVAGSSLPVADTSMHLGPVMLPWPEKPTWVDAVYCTAASTAYAYTVPTWAHYVMLSGNSPFYAAFETQLTGVTAIIPTGAVTSGAAPFLNPVLVPVTGGSTISFISATAANIITIAPLK